MEVHRRGLAHMTLLLAWMPSSCCSCDNVPDLRFTSCDCSKYGKLSFPHLSSLH